MLRKGSLRIKGGIIPNQSNQNQNQSWHVVFTKEVYVIIKGTMKQGEPFTNMFVPLALAWGGKIDTCQKTVKCPPRIQKTNRALPEGSAKV